MRVAFQGGHVLHGAWTFRFTQHLARRGGRAAHPKQRALLERSPQPSCVCGLAIHETLVQRGAIRLCRFALIKAFTLCSSACVVAPLVRAAVVAAACTGLMWSRAARRWFEGVDLPLSSLQVRGFQLPLQYVRGQNMCHNLAKRRCPFKTQDQYWYQ